MQSTQKPAKGAVGRSRRWDGEPETDFDRRFFDLRESGYTGWIDQDGYPVLKPGTAVAGASVAAVLRSAATYLRWHGWIQGAYYDMSATCFTPAACLVGALGAVCYGGPVEAPAQQFDQPGFDEFEAALAFLDAHLWQCHGFGYDTAGANVAVTAYDFNDAKGRTADQVIGMLRQAAQAWEHAAAAEGVELARVLHDAASSTASSGIGIFGGAA